jgi:uncharacterized protein (DUF2141 family)
VRHRPRLVLALGCLTALPLLAGAGAGGSGPGVTVDVTGLRSARGVVRACMTSHPNRFPRCRGDANAYGLVVRAGSSVTLEFDDVTPGRYAIALLHDENDNGKADRALSLMPKEGYGFSRDAPVRMGPPSFDQAAFDVGGTRVRQTIRMRYML